MSAAVRTVAPRGLPHRLAPLVGVGIALAALVVLKRELATLRFQDVARRMSAIPRARLVEAGALTAAGFGVLACFDGLALRYIRRAIEYRKVAFTTFIAYAFSQALGFPLFTGGSVRYRLYTAAGLTAAEIAQVVAFSTLTLVLGILAVGGATFLLDPVVLAAALHLPAEAVRAAGGICVGLVCGYLALSAARPAPLAIRGWRLRVPSLGLALGQLVVAALDWIIASSVLFVLLRPATLVPYPAFLSVFVLAQVAGLVSHVPGGLGVFDSIIVLSLAHSTPPAALLGSLLAYRVIYYLLPFGVATILLSGAEVWRQRGGLTRLARLTRTAIPALAPSVFALATFIAGVVLLFSGATPAVGSRLRWLDRVLPLAVVETSHFMGSLAGVGLILLARGLQLRLDAAYRLTVSLLVAGIVASLLKGLDYEEAATLLLVLAALLPVRREFFRRASLLSQRFTPEWTAAIVLVIAASVWLGFFAYRHVQYQADLWWRFALHGDAPRFLRATVGVIGVAAAVAAARLLRPSPPAPMLPGPDELDRVQPVATGASDLLANLALLGDKALLLSQAGTGFLMYGVAGRSWVALGDPVGSRDEQTELAWRFRELVERERGWTVFYEVSSARLDLYIDLGLTLLKVGEQARVPLDGFSLEGPSRSGLRRVQRRLAKQGCTVEVVSPDGVPALFPELRRISATWLEHKHTREKGFSLGRFDEAYLRRFPVAVVRYEGRALAFANLWGTGGKTELSLDLMRYVPGAPWGVMEYLLIELMLWSSREGYRWFNLGMAPFSGLQSRALAPLWSRAGALLYRRGEPFYHFQGLREYKEKFDPVWVPRFLASPGGPALPLILMNVATLISGGLRGVVAK